MEEDQGEFAYLEGQSRGDSVLTHLKRGDGRTGDVVVGYYGNQEPAPEVQEFGNGWDTDLHEMQAMSSNHHHHQQQQQQHLDFYLNNEAQSFDCAALPAETLYNPTPDLLNLLHLAKCHGSSTVPFANTHDGMATNTPNISAEQGLLEEPYLLPGGHVGTPWSSSSVFYDPLSHPNQAPPQPPIMKELFQSLSLHGHYDLNVIGSGSDEGVGGGIAYGEDNGDARKYEKRLLDFGPDIDACIVKRKKVKLTEHYTTERDRRTQLNQKYDTLKSLIPNPTKSDRASVVGDAIDYIQELKRTVNELRLLAERKRQGKQRNRRLPSEISDRVGDIDGESTITKLPLAEPDQSSHNGTLRTSWLQRKSKVTVLDVRIIDDEVTVKIMQRKRINCLLHVARVLDDLQLDLHNVAGGHIGEHFSFLFNAKILEGSLVHASAIASRVMESVDGQNGTTSPRSGY
ncbi:hypothetical protein MLD38_019229 [Melastoma candidum]|uniref:Uncharacterized protein n=1 Tax=Melastoma candidum TaxID=119954 RepID=A0ACB9QZT5_9MYRT|nr:hypothetical protein MLD38_019229 [Melastoma candidum]